MSMDSTPPSKNTVGQTGFKKEDLTICCLQQTHLIDRNKYWLSVKGWKKIYQVNCLIKQAGVPIFISDKEDFKLILIKQDKEGYLILIKGTIHQKDIKIINLYTPDVSAPYFIKNTKGPKRSCRLQYSGSGRF
jgi:exonuclease III